MQKVKSSRIVRPVTAESIRYRLPQSWVKAAGLLRNRRRELERHLKAVRHEWDL